MGGALNSEQLSCEVRVYVPRREAQRGEVSCPRTHSEGGRSTRIGTQMCQASKPSYPRSARDLTTMALEQAKSRAADSSCSSECEAGRGPSWVTRLCGPTVRGLTQGGTGGDGAGRRRVSEPSHSSFDSGLTQL